MKKVVSMGIWKLEACLRIVSALLLLLTALLLGFDRQTKLLFNTISKKADVRSLDAFFIAVWINAAGAVYNLIQLVRSSKLPGFQKNLVASDRYAAWGIYLSDQVAAYVVLGGNLAALQASMLALSGDMGFQWMKLCNSFTRFCVQAGAADVLGVAAGVIMAITACISALSLFRLYSPNHFLMLKPNLL